MPRSPVAQNESAAAIHGLQWKQSDGKQGEGAFSAARLQAVLEGAYEYELELASDLAVGVINDFQTMSIRQSLLLGTTG